MAECNLLDALIEGATTEGNAYHNAILVFLFVSVLTFIVSTLSKNYSQTDKLWSIVPFIYAWIAVCDARTLLMAVLATVWGIRLTWNFHRRGGYKWPPWEGDEDYRWKEIQEGRFLKIFTHPLAWNIFNLTFISFYQMFILLMIASPSYVAYTVAKCEPTELKVLDGVAVVLYVTFIIVESIADNQQFCFQSEKYRRKNAGERLTGEFADGFKQSNMFAIVRKPNYASEQAIWISFYLFSVAATGRAWNWSAVGWICLCLLFQTSGWFTERLTRSKYPKYDEYMKRVPLYVPNPFSVRPKMKAAR